MLQISGRELGTGELYRRKECVPICPPGPSAERPVLRIPTRDSRVCPHFIDTIKESMQRCTFVEN